MKQGRLRRWKCCVFAFVLTLMMGLSLVQGAIETPAATADAGDYNLHLIMAIDDDGNYAYVSAVVISGDGDPYVLTDDLMLDYTAYSMYLVLNSGGEDDIYQLTNPKDLGCGMASFSFSDSEPASSEMLELGTASEGESVTAVALVGTASEGESVTAAALVEDAVFFAIDGEIESVDAKNGDGYYEIEVYSAETMPDYYSPMWVFDESNNLVGIFTSDEAIYAFQTGLSRDLMIKIAVGVAAVVLIIVVVLCLTKKGKQPPEEPPKPIPQPIPEPIPQPISEPEPIPEPEPTPQSISRIIGVSGSMSGRVYQVNADSIMFGRDPSAYIRFAPETKGVSRNHCRLFKNHSGSWMIMDCGSSYGTMLKRYGRLQPQHPVPVQPGDVIWLGSQKNEFRLQ